MVAYAGSHIVATTALSSAYVQTTLQTVIPSHSNWSLVESTTMNAGAVSCDVYKCSSVGNGLGVDFYVAVMLSGSNVSLGIAEGYNTSTHKPKRPATHAPVALNTLQADGGFMPATTEIDWFNGTFNPGGGAGTVFASASANPMYTGSAVDDWHVSLAADGFFFFSRAAGTFGYAGVYESLVATPATNDPLPLLVGQGGLGNSMSIVHQAMRHPLCGGQSIGYGTNCNGNAATGSENTSTPFSVAWSQPGAMGTIGNGVTADNTDLYAGGATNVNRVLILNSFVNTSATVGRDKNGYARGFHKRVRQMTSVITGMTYGDTVTIDGVTYMYTGSNNIWVESNPA